MGTNCPESSARPRPNRPRLRWVEGSFSLPSAPGTTAAVFPKNCWNCSLPSFRAWVLAWSAPGAILRRKFLMTLVLVVSVTVPVLPRPVPAAGFGSGSGLAGTVRAGCSVRPAGLVRSRPASGCPEGCSGWGAGAVRAGCSGCGTVRTGCSGCGAVRADGCRRAGAAGRTGCWAGAVDTGLDGAVRGDFFFSSFMLGRSPSRSSSTVVEKRSSATPPLISTWGRSSAPMGPSESWEDPGAAVSMPTLFRISSTFLSLTLSRTPSLAC